jgi:hypothetical protein
MLVRDLLWGLFFRLVFREKSYCSDVDLQTHHVNWITKVSSVIPKENYLTRDLDGQWWKTYSSSRVPLNYIYCAWALTARSRQCCKCSLDVGFITLKKHSLWQPVYFLSSSKKRVNICVFQAVSKILWMDQSGAHCELCQTGYVGDPTSGGACTPCLQYCSGRHSH